MKIDRNTRSTLLYLLFSVAVTILVFSYLFSHITWAEVHQLIIGIDRPLVGLFVLLSMGMHLARTQRYRVVLDSVGQHTGFLRLFLVVLVRSLCVDLLPARTGELVYLYLLRAKLRVELGAATASFALAFLFDIIALAPLLVVALLFVGVGLPFSWWGALGASVFLLVLSAVLIALLPLGLRWAFAIGSGGLMGHGRWRQRVRRFLASTHRQVLRARRQGVYLPVFLWSLAVRVLKYVALYVLLLALLKPQGFTMAGLPFQEVFLGLCAAEMAASLPFSGIAGFGAYEGAWALVFLMLGYDAEVAKTAGVSHHLLTQIYGYGLGLLALLLLSLTRGRSVRRKA